MATFSHRRIRQPRLVVPAPAVVPEPAPLAVLPTDDRNYTPSGNPIQALFDATSYPASREAMHTPDGSPIQAVRFVNSTGQSAGGAYGQSPRQFGAVGDGVANDTAAVQACLDAAAAGDFAVDMTGSWTYRVTQITVPDGVVMEGSASTIAITDTLTDPAAVAIAIGVGCTIETLTVTSPGPGAGATEIISIGSATRIGMLSIAATIQRTGGGITTKGQDVGIDYLKSVNFDRPFHAYNGGEAAPTTGLHIGYADITSYVRGVKCTFTYGWTLGGYHMRGRSANAHDEGHPGTPGQNGILLLGCSDFTIGPGIIENAGEHSFRIGGAEGEGGATSNGYIGHLTSVRSRACAFKINAGGVGEYVTRITVEGVTGIDCGEKPAGPTPDNMECVRVSNSRGVVFEGPIVAATREFGAPCSHVLMLSDVQDFSAPSVYAETPPPGSLVLFTQTGDGDPGNVENVHIGSVVGEAGLDAVRCNITSYNVGNIFISNMLLLGQAVGRRVANVDAPLALSGPIHIAGVLLGATVPAFILPNDPLVTRDFSWAGKRVTGRSTGGSFLSPHEWVTGPFTNEVTSTYAGGPYINSTSLSTAATGNYGAGLFGSRLGSSRRGWGIWPVQTGTSLQVGVVIGTCDTPTSANETLMAGLTVGHRGALTSPAMNESVVAPGAGFAKLVWVLGTTAGTAKLLAYAGTSTTPVTIVDNVGSGV